MALVLAATALALTPNPAMGAAAEVERPDRLSGIDRYGTAVKIAEAYVAEVESTSGRRSVDTVILTSGLDAHFGYALPTPALSRLYEAPVLLTEPDKLPSAVTTFLTQPAISRVYIVGDTSVVSAAVERAVDAISGVTVSRIANVSTSYAAAVAMANLAGWSPGSPGEVRGKGRTALLATGENFADALAAGPLAYRGEHPILLTPSTALPAAVSTFLRDSRTEHVIILGGNRAVSAGIENDVKSLGITVERWMGTDRFGTAIDIAEALLGFDTPQECFDSSGDIGLAYGWRSPDAIVSGPLLGELCAPLLLTERDTLPSAVGDFLKSDNWVTGDAAGKLRFTVFGGTAAVANRVVNQATDVAELAALSAAFEATEGGCQFTVTFAEPVLRADAALAANYLNGNSPFTDSEIEGSIDVGSGTSTTKAVVTLVGGTVNTGATVPTGCSTALGARDRIGIIGGGIRATADNRRVGRVEYIVADDATAPALTVNAPEGSGKVWVESDEPLVESVLDADTDVRVVFRRSRLVDQVVEVPLVAGVTRFEADVPDTFGSALKIGDSVSVAADEVRDLAGNANQAVRTSVIRDTTAPRASRITATAPKPTDFASVTLNGTDTSNTSRAAARIDARAGTAADGAGGNEWSIDLDVRSSRPTGWSSNQLASVQVSAATRRILVTALVFVGNPSNSADIGDVVDALNAQRSFTALFTAVVEGGAGSDVPVDTGGRVQFNGGKSTVDLTLEWTEAVRTGDNASDCTQSTDHPVRVRLIEIDADGNGTTDFDLEGFTFGTTDLKFIADDSGPAIAGSATCDTATAGARPGTLVARIESASIDDLPSERSTATVRSGAVTDLAGNPNTRQAGLRLQRP